MFQGFPLPRKYQGLPIGMDPGLRRDDGLATAFLKARAPSKKRASPITYDGT
jgi:hypothetical protein